MSIGVLLADDHRITRQGLRALLEEQDDINVVGEAADGRSAVRLAHQLCPDVVIMGVAIPELNGIEATSRIVATCPGVRIVALSRQPDRRSVSGMLAAGASAYLLKTCDFDELMHAIHVAVGGETYLSPKIAGTVVRDYVDHLAGEDAAPASVLSSREREVLQLLAEGKTTKQVATLLHVSVKTVHTHRQHVMDKLKFTGVAELTKYAIREGLTTLGP